VLYVSHTSRLTGSLRMHVSCSIAVFVFVTFKLIRVLSHIHDLVHWHTGTDLPPRQCTRARCHCTCTDSESDRQVSRRRGWPLSRPSLNLKGPRRHGHGAELACDQDL
jgi:hypothetical protein